MLRYKFSIARPFSLLRLSLSAPSRWSSSLQSLRSSSHRLCPPARTLPIGLAPFSFFSYSLAAGHPLRVLIFRRPTASLLAFPPHLLSLVVIDHLPATWPFSTVCDRITISRYVPIHPSCSPLLKPPCSCVFLLLCSNIAHLNLSVPNPVAYCLPRGLSQQIPSLSNIAPVSAFPRCSAAFSRWFPNHRLFSFHKSHHFGFIPEPSILHITADCLVTRAVPSPAFVADPTWRD